MSARGESTQPTKYQQLPIPARDQPESQDPEIGEPTENLRGTESTPQLPKLSTGRFRRESPERSVGVLASVRFRRALHSFSSLVARPCSALRPLASNLRD